SWVMSADDHVTTSNLELPHDKFADHCRREPEKCEQEVTTLFANFIATVKEMSTPIQKSELRVVVRSAESVESARHRLAGRPNSDFVARQFVGGLWALLVADSAHAIKSVSAQNLAPLGLSADAAMSLGEQNVAAELGPFNRAIHDLPPNGVGY